jgi:hypothetical protein
MPRPFTAAQQAENDHFLEMLGQTGNARLAARSVGRRLSTMFHRRGAHSAFAQEWEAKAAAAHARFHLAGGKRGPEPSARPRDPLRTEGGEAMVVRTRTGRLQIRLAHPGKLTHAAEQTFLRALSATANVRLAAAAAGASVAAFYRRRRLNPVFAREMRLALKMGFERIEAAALDAALPEAHRRDAWARGEPPPIPPLSWDQAFQLLCFHEKSVRQGWEQPHRRRRRGESDEIYSARLAAMWKAEKDLEAEAAALRRAARFDETGDWRFEDEAPPPPLPPLELVTGWSRAKGKPAHSDLALFGGWRIGEMEESRRSGASTGVRKVGKG